MTSCRSEYIYLPLLRQTPGSLDPAWLEGEVSTHQEPAHWAPGANGSVTSQDVLRHLIGCTLQHPWRPGPNSHFLSTLDAEVSELTLESRAPWVFGELSHPPTHVITLCTLGGSSWFLWDRIRLVGFIATGTDTAQLLPNCSHFFGRKSCIDFLRHPDKPIHTGLNASSPKWLLCLTD